MEGGLCRIYVTQHIRYHIPDTFRPDAERQVQAAMYHSPMVRLMSSGPDERSLSRFRAAALIAAPIAAVGAVGFLLRTTGRNPSQLLIVFLAIWVVSPFVAL